MCRKLPDQCKAKVKCKCYVKPVDKEQRDGKLNLNAVDSSFEQQSSIIEIKES